MKNKSKTIVFFGSDDFSLPSLKRLLSAGYLPAAVITKPPKRSGRGRKDLNQPVADFAAQKKLILLQPNKLAEATKDIQSLQPDIGIVVSYGKIIPDNLLELFPNGIINIHPSLLPKYRGPSPISAPILAGDKKTGVSLMRLSAEMDAGPVYAQRNYLLEGTETSSQLRKVLAEIGAEMLIAHLGDILAGNIEPKPQEDTKASYTHIIKKEDGRIDWALPAEQIERQVRAFIGWPSSYTSLAGNEVALTGVEISTQNGTPGQPFPVDKTSFGIYAGKGSIVVKRLKPAGKKEMSAREFLNGQTLF